MKKNYVTFYSPGTMVAEMTKREVPSWSVAKVLKILPDIEERHGAKPYGFRFTTMKRGIRDFAPREVAQSNMYYVNCSVQTLKEVEAEGPESATLAQNMKTNKWDRIVTTNAGWKWSHPLEDGDIVL